MSDPDRFESRDVVVVRHDPRVTAAAVVVCVLGLAVIVLIVVLHVRVGLATRALMITAFVGFLGGLFAALMSLDVGLRPRRDRGLVVADRSGVTLDGARITPVGPLDGLVLPRPGERPTVVLRPRRGLGIALLVRDVEEGRAILRALGLGATRAWARFEVPAHVAWRPLADVGGAVGLGGALLATLLQAGQGHRVAMGVAMLVGYCSLIANAIAERRKDGVTVGADGVLLTRRGGDRLLPYADVSRVDVRARSRFTFGRRGWAAVRIHLRSGEVVELALGRPARDRAEAGVLAERIAEGIDASRRRDAATDGAVLRRADRTVREWVRALRSMGAGARDDHRTAPVVPERLWRLVEDPSAAAEARASAAIVLAAAREPGADERLRSAAGATAALRLRVAIDAAAGSDDAALEEALAALEAERDAAAR